MDADPFKLFDLWLEAALASGVMQPLGMTLATASAEGRPSARIVLLRGVEDRGFVFYTNYDSRKGRELAARPDAALVWWWPELGRQVRAEGVIRKTSPQTATAYFKDRPLGSQIAAAISPQSEVIPDRETLLEKWRELERRLEDTPLERPDYWGGYRLEPTVFEFWQEGANRLHDRFRYTLDSASGNWILERLAP